MEGFTEEHQSKLKEAKVLVIGAGGLGSPVLLYLAAAGIGSIGIVEFDTVSLSNLNRQVLYTHSDVGKSKAKLAGKIVRNVNPYCEINVLEEKWEDKERALNIAKNYEIIVDCTDNYSSRLLTDLISRELCIPFVYGAIYNYEGQVSVFNYKGCRGYRDFIKEEPEKRQKQVGVLGPLPGIIGSIQAVEVIKIVSGTGEVLADKMLICSVKYNRYQVLEL
ncbi:MAG: HesA/MoeB/ThiF family protein [Bacteroidales bacterium]|nr:HesA/MoeB/ThiF family protein [Bacteroidales bacterium]